LTPLQTDLAIIASLAEEKEEEHYQFRNFLQKRDAAQIDRMVHQLNDTIAPQIDCTQCGNCCKTLMIGIAPQERSFFAAHFNLPPAEAEAKYLSQSIGGDTIMANMPCVFLCNNKCTVYEQRFADCRNFPNLHQPGFVNRLFSMVMHYGSCPIVHNVTEALKRETGFVSSE
jgi:uncharacterized protein